jgi:hypothetical protein
MWEVVYNHYVNLKGIDAPYVAEAAARVRPERGPQGGHPSAYDFLSYGTLTYTLDPIKEGVAPSGLRALWSGSQVTLSWWGSAHAEGYQVQRASQSGGPYVTIGTTGPKDLNFIDQNVAQGATYHYVVTSKGPGVWKGKTSAELEVRQKLMAKYDFNGNTRDSAGQSRDAVATGAPAYTQGHGNGSFRAIEFDGKNDYLTLPPAIANFQDITIAAWVYWDGGKDFQRVFDFGGDVTKNMFFTVKAGDKMRFEITTSRGTDGTGRLEAPAMKPHRWTHIAITLNNHTGTVYVDGEVVATGPILLDPLFTQNHCYIGKSQYPDPLFKGRIEDFRIYDYGLSAEAVREAFQGRK